MHDDVTRSPWRFSIRDLLIAVACISLLLALVVLPIRAARERARQTACMNNLKQILLSTHNFHDTYNGLPPLGVGPGRPSFFVLLEPYCESGRAFISYGINSAGLSAFETPYDGANGVWSQLAADEQLYGLASCKWMRCPARDREIWSVVTPEDTNYFGATGDYAVVFFNGRVQGSPVEFRAERDWELHYDPCNERHVERQFGAVRLANVDFQAVGGPAFKTWKPRDTFARITDGAANTLLVGEKYVRRGELNRYADDPEQQDGTYLFESDQRRSASVARNLWFPLAYEDDPRFRLGKKASPQRNFGFGGPHSDGVLFGVADGSVRTVAHQTDRTLLYRLGHCQDALGLAGIGPLVTPADAFDFDDPSEPAVPVQR